MELTKQVTVNASADKVWKIVGTDFNDISEWASPVLESHANPNLPKGEKGRVCQVKGSGEIIENIYEYSDEQRELAFTLEGGKFPFFVKGIANIWHIEPKGDDQSVVSIGVDMQLMPVFSQLLNGRLQKAIGKQADAFLGELKYYAENDQPKVA